MNEHDGFDEMLERALRDRPEPERGPARLDIAAMAMARATEQEQRLARIARLSRWTCVASVAAGLLIAATVAAGYILWPTSTTSSVADVSSTTSSTPDLTVVGGLALGIALVVLMLLTVMTPERPTMRLMPA